MTLIGARLLPRGMQVLLTAHRLIAECRPTLLAVLHNASALTSRVHSAVIIFGKPSVRISAH